MTIRNGKGPGVVVGGWALPGGWQSRGVLRVHWTLTTRQGEPLSRAHARLNRRCAPVSP